jgi:uncharacterized membrane protein
LAAAGIALAYLSASQRLSAALSLALVLGAPLVAAVAAAWRTRWRSGVIAAALLALLAAFWKRDALAAQVPALWLSQHLAVHLLLATYFGASLLPHRVPVATRIARAVLPSLSPAVRTYSRRVTQCWAAYFVLVAASSLAIYLYARPAWAAFAMVTSGPLVALLFALEFAVRRIVLPARDCASMADTVRGFRALFRADAGAARSHG